MDRLEPTARTVKQVMLLIGLFLTGRFFTGLFLTRFFVPTRMGVAGSFVNLTTYSLGFFISFDYSLVGSLTEFTRRRIRIPPFLRLGLGRATRSQCDQSGQQDSSGAFSP
jgi:hypothetical protein